MTRPVVQVPQHPGQDYQYQPQVPQSTAGPGRGPAEYNPSSNAHAGMNGYHNPEAGNPSPAANYSPDPGAVAEELLQVRQTDICLVSRAHKMLLASKLRHIGHPACGVCTTTLPLPCPSIAHEAVMEALALSGLSRTAFGE